MSRPAHLNGAVEYTLADLEKNRGWKIILEGDHYTLYCKVNAKQGTVTTNQHHGTARDQVLAIIRKHGQVHPAEH